MKFIIFLVCLIASTLAFPVDKDNSAAVRKVRDLEVDVDVNGKYLYTYSV